MILLQAQQADYGTLAPLVKTVGWLTSSAFAIALAWRGRGRWEPSEEDLDKGPARVAGLLTAIAIAVIWTSLASAPHRVLLTKLAVGLGLACALFLMLYGLLISTMTYVQIITVAANQPRERRIIGGFSLTPGARVAQKERHLTIQKLFAGAAYDIDEIWTRLSRGMSKLSFVVCYIGLVTCGSVALSCAAILLLLPQPSP